jgi:hypothetical protein
LKSQLAAEVEVDHREVVHQVEQMEKAKQGIQEAEAETLVQGHIQVRAAEPVVQQFFL